MRGHRLTVAFVLALPLILGAQAALACDRSCQVYETIKGRWWAGDFEFADMGRCAVEESVDLILEIDALDGARVTGTYTERLRRAPAYRDCGGSRGYEFVYAVAFDLPADSARRALPVSLDLTQCRPANKAQCEATASRTTGKVVLPTDGATLLFDGIAFTKAD